MTIKIKYKTLDGLEATEERCILPVDGTIVREKPSGGCRSYRFSHVQADGIQVYVEAGSDHETRDPSPGAKLYGQACAREQVARDLLDRAKRAWLLAEALSPEEVRDFAICLLKQAEAERENGREEDRIAQELAE